MKGKPVRINVPLKSVQRYLQSEVPTVYTNENIQVFITLSDTTAEELAGATVITYLQTADSVLHDNVAALNGNTIEYVLTEPEGDCPGLARFEFVVRFPDVTSLTSPAIYFNIRKSLSDD